MKGRAGSSPQRMIRGLKVGIMGCIENHLEIGKGGDSNSFWVRRNQDSRAAESSGHGEWGEATMGTGGPREDRGLVLTAYSKMRFSLSSLG